MPRKESSAPSPRSFEENLGELEELVEAMENDQLPLEKLVAHYERGARLLQHCEQILAAAGKRIELIEVGPAAENKLEPPAGEGDDTGTAGSPDPGEKRDDEIRLL